MKVKIFEDGGSGSERLEKDINEWLSKNPDITITHICQSEGTSGWVTLSIFYY